MPLTAAQIAEQQKQAEELLGATPETLGFAKALFFGHFNAPLLFPYPEVQLKEREQVDRSVAEVRRFLEEKVDAAAIDRDANIPAHVIAGLGDLGVLGMTAPPEFGGRGFSQLAYLKVMELLGGHDPSVAVFVNAHHSIGIRALLLFGTQEQKRHWLPDLVNGRKLAAFALTEPNAGSDAANVQTTATPTADGSAYVLNGEKRYITNGGIAGMLTVMARTPVEASPGRQPGESKITAFIVSPDMPGFEVVEARMPKCGIRGTATARLAFHDMRVPKENVLGPIGKGLRVALTVLDFGRTTFGASCTGAAKSCFRLALQHAKRRKQFGQALAEFELVKKKIAYMAACAFAMEATTAECASFIDRGFEDYMLETAMLKVWSTDALWTIVNDALQIYGGQGYFTTDPLERMMRDARINMIGEGANDVLRAFISVVGSRAVGEGLLEVLRAAKSPFKGAGRLWRFGKEQLAARLSSPEVPVQNAALRMEAGRLGQRIKEFGLAVQWVLRHTGSVENFLPSEYLHERIADAACELYASSCTLARLDHLLTAGNGHPTELDRDVQAGRYFLTISDRRVRQCLAALSENDDAETTRTADAVLR
jgi:alkylation response protein AidB-like acyl-CoA dehydrogenase